jgi:hypothetical protein
MTSARFFLIPMVHYLSLQLTTETKISVKNFPLLKKENCVTNRFLKSFKRYPWQNEIVSSTRHLLFTIAVVTFEQGWKLTRSSFFNIECPLKLSPKVMGKFSTAHDVDDPNTLKIDPDYKILNNLVQRNISVSSLSKFLFYQNDK